MAARWPQNGRQGLERKILRSCQLSQNKLLIWGAVVTEKKSGGKEWWKYRSTNVLPSRPPKRQSTAMPTLVPIIVQLCLNLFFCVTCQYISPFQYFKIYNHFYLGLKKTVALWTMMMCCVRLIMLLSRCPPCPIRNKTIYQAINYHCTIKISISGARATKTLSARISAWGVVGSGLKLSCGKLSSA